jgi:CspA family cold shock protein
LVTARCVWARHNASADELHGLIEDMIKLLEAKVQPDLRRGRYPDKRTAQNIAKLVHAVARELEV